MNQNTHAIRKTLLLVLTAMIWGFAFVSQSVGAQYVGAYTFLASRSWLAVIVLCPVVAASDRQSLKRNGTNRAPKTREQKKQLLLGGTIVGSFLFVASVLQQLGIASTSAAKSGFITALYVVLVPVISLFLGSRPTRKIWLGVVLGVLGLYFLCMSGGLDAINSGDVLTMFCALMFSFQILSVNYYVQFVDGIRLSRVQMVVTAVLATVCMVIFEHPTADGIRAALIPILYAGIMSSGVGYTLQIVAQDGLNPTIASLAMSLESVFSAVGGWLILNQKLTLRELSGCILMFTAIVIAQLPDRKQKEMEGKQS